MGIAALILGILALASCCSLLFVDIAAVIAGLAALILGIIGLILGIIAVRRAEKKGAAIAGLVSCVIALAVAITIMVLIGIGIEAVMSDPVPLEQSEQQTQAVVDAPESAAPTVAASTIAPNTAAPTTEAPDTAIPATTAP